MSAILNEIQTFMHFWNRHRFALPPNALLKGIQLLSTCSIEFRQNYSLHHFTKIVSSFSFFECYFLKQKESVPHKEQVLCRLIKTHYSENNELGISVGVHVGSDSETLSLEQLLGAITHLLPGVESIPHLSYRYRDEQNKIVYLYLEIEKRGGRGISHADIQHLKTHLAKEITDSIQTLFPPLFVIRNEEEIFRNIVQMSRELKQAEDLPQVTISFQEQTPKGWLRFSIVIVHVVEKTKIKISDLNDLLPETIQCFQEMATIIGTIDQTYSKQANLMTFEIEGSLFSKKNGAINLQEARAYIAKGLELILGDFRDYNGGLFSRQNKQLKEIKETIEDENKFLFETIFYSFTPSLFQSFILPEAAKACASLFLDAKITTLDPLKSYVILKECGDNFSLVVIKTSEEATNARIQNEISNYNFPLHQFGYVTQSINGEYYLGLVYQYPTNIDWFNPIESLLKDSHILPVRVQKILRINFQDGDPLSLNPQHGLDLRCRSLQKALFEGLTRINPSGNAELAAAEQVKISPDGTTYLFTLKKLQWSNGEAITACQFEKTWKKAILSPSCLRPDFFYIIQNAHQARHGEVGVEEIGVKALDKNTLSITLEYPAHYFLQMLAHPLFFPLYETQGEPFVYSGPFSLRSWKRNNSLVLSKNPYYWDFENVKLDGVEISIIPDPHIALEKYQNGELDWIGGPFGLLSSSFHHYVSHPDLKSADSSGVSWLYCNFNHPLLRSAKIRRALSYALDRDQISKKTFHNPIACQTHLPPSLSSLNDEDLKYENFHTLFEEGLKETSFTKAPPLVLFHSNIPGQDELTLEIQQQWRQTFGIEIERKEKDWNSFSQHLDNQCHFSSRYRHPFYNDALYFLNIFYDSKNIHNLFGWHSETFNHWVQKALTHPEKKEFVQKAEEELLHQMPVIPLHRVSYYYLAKEELEGIHFCHSGDVDLKWVYFNTRSP